MEFTPLKAEHPLKGDKKRIQGWQAYRKVD